MPVRFALVGLIALLGLLLLLGGAVAESNAPDYDAYVVGQNETLASIAADYGISADYLAQFNKLALTDALQVGQVLMVPRVAQTPKASSANTVPASTPAPPPMGEQVQGVLATVTASSTAIWSKPGGGVLLFARATQGTELLITGISTIYYSVLMADGSTGWVLKAGVTLSDRQVTVEKPIAPAPPAAPVSNTPSPSTSAIVQTALDYLGIPYKYGGRLPGSIDCSLFVQTVFARNGIKLPRTAAQQSQVGAPVEVAALQPGDRLYFRMRGGTIGHTGIYIGNGQFIHASSNRGAVAVDLLTNPTYWRKFAGARR